MHIILLLFLNYFTHSRLEILKALDALLVRALENSLLKIQDAAQLLSTTT